MAKGSHLFNKKARQKKTVSIDDSATKQIVVEDADILKGKYDECNALALPSKKRKVKTTFVEGSGSGGVGRGKLLSRKQKLRLEAIVARREKKKHRADILSELQKHQIPSHTLDSLTPLVKVQTEGTRRSTANAISQTLAGIAGRKQEEEEQRKQAAISAAAVANGKKPKPLRFRSWSRRFISSLNQKDVKNDPKVLGFEEEVDSSSDEEEESEAEDAENGNGQDVEMIEPKVEDSGDQINLSQEDVEMDDESDDDVKLIPEETESPEKSEISKSTDKKPDKKGVGTAAPKTKPKVIPKNFVTVVRKKEIQDKRSKLPILAEEQVIMESITDNAVTVVAGETGSGKTTQIPQFLYEAGYTLQGRMIGITEPRRVAAVSMSRRVGVELNLSSKEVSYQIRYEGNASKSTKIKFMTDGVLLKEMEKDFLLSNYSAICIDEAHERSLYTDILIGLLSRCVLVRAKRQDPLKLIIMSATLRVEDFVENSRLFKTPPTLIHIPARQFPVQVHFSRTTPENYVLAAFKKVVQIHKKLPPGGILVFVTGQQEVRTLVKQLSNLCNKRGTDVLRKRSNNLSKQKGSASKKPSSKPDLRTFDLSKIDESAPLASAEGDDDGLSDDSDDEFLFSAAGNAGEEWELDEEDIPETPLHILPLYSMLSSADQQKIFEPPPEGSRLCVISTNVAETSLTIPSIRYVVDTGKVKQKIWDKVTGVQQFSVQWESKASAEQRAGRAGRVGPGHCYRLFSSTVFDSEFEKYSTPEIQVRPVDDMMLLMKSMSIERVSNFPFPSHPGDVQLRNAENILKALGALEEASPSGSASNTSPSLTISELGKTMARFPIGPRFAKMLALSFSTHLVSFVIALVAALSVQEIFIESTWETNSSENKKKWKAIKRQWAGSGSAFLLGDAMVALKAVGAFEYSGGSEAFCIKSGLRHKAMMEIRKLRRQLTSEVNTLATSGNEIPVDPQMKPPSDKDTILLRQILLSGLPDKIARKAQDAGDTNSSDKDFKHAYRCGEMEELVYIHNSSVLYDNDPDWVVYQEVFESTGKMYLRGVTAIEPQWIPVFCESLCRLEQVLTQPPPFYDEETGLVKCHQKVSYGRQGWELPIARCEYPLRLQKYKLFAQFLLEGQVFPEMKRWTPHLLSLPITMTKPWAKLQPRTQSFLKALTDNGIHRKEHLQNKWTSSNSSSFLLEQYLEWLPEELHAAVKKAWPPIGPS